MKRIKLLSLTLAITIFLCSVAGCAGKNKSEKNANSEVVNTEDSTSQVNSASNKNLLDGFKAEKIGTVNKGKEIYTISSNFSSSGVYYKDGKGKFGIMSFDGKKDTGAKYTYCESLDKYFTVATSEITATEDIVSAINCIGLVDINGKEIIPMKYANISQINERYYQLYEATGTTTNKSDALVFSSNDFWGSVFPDDDDTLFTGKWYIYDIISGKMVEGATGTKAYYTYGYGNFIKYTTDDEETVTINHKGDKLNTSMLSNVNLFDNGNYTIDEGDKGTLYNSEGEKLFEYNEKDFVPQNSLGDYFYALWSNGGTIKYAIMDNTGKVISSEFNSIPSIYGKFIHVDKKLCDMQGKPIVEGEFDRVIFDNVFKNSYFLVNGSNFTCIDVKGNVLYEGTNSESTHYAIKDDSKKYYSFKDKAFNIEGSSCLTSWLVKSMDENYNYNLIDSISGATLLSGYTFLDVAETNNNTVYVYAQNTDGGYDIYSIK